MIPKIRNQQDPITQILGNFLPRKFQGHTTEKNYNSQKNYGKLQIHYHEVKK